jgi:hypothetical protein
MKTLTLIAALVLNLGLAGYASANVPEGVRATDLQHVGQIRMLGSLNGWGRIDDDSLIVWTTPSQPYLIELSRKSHGMRFAQALGVTSTAGQIAEKFDSVIIDGIRYPIQAIYKLDSKTARQLTRKS